MSTGTEPTAGAVNAASAVVGVLDQYIEAEFLHFDSVQSKMAAAIDRYSGMSELLEALQLIQGFNWQLDDSEHGKEIKRLALAAIARAEGRQSP